MLFASALFCLCFGDAEAKRVALIIGNAAYRVGPLANPVNDATAVAEAFIKLGFEKVVLKTDLTGNDLRSELRDFSSDAAGADVAVVYYAGHGTEIGGQNYLIPIDAQLARASDVAFEAVALSDVLAGLEGARNLRLIILDACRNNFFPMAGGTRSVHRGLARIEPENNSLVAYAAKEGTTAEDGAGRTHSPFTEALLKYLATPGLEVRLMFGRVRDAVMAATSPPQQPYIYGTLGGTEVYLNKSAPLFGGTNAERLEEVRTTYSKEGNSIFGHEGEAFLPIGAPFVGKWATSQSSCSATGTLGDKERMVIFYANYAKYIIPNQVGGMSYSVDHLCYGGQYSRSGDAASFVAKCDGSVLSITSNGLMMTGLGPDGANLQLSKCQRTSKAR